MVGQHRGLVMKKIPRASHVGDFLHKGFVLTCVGVTLYGFANVGSRIYNYYSVVKPQKQAEEDRQQRLTDGDTEMKDIALPLKA
ncbi:hypothetical protein Pcinc_027844 [Petrolisthes cinctipes]|uniref:Uncharacterized protein n=1 Tax=Petrolisthes cinctipes TaxID=88211 RepID=A0AAE1F4C0_PETCI|nr:hypothetical protein Pcinc_027844 [Petrolisthes cinctipes]